MSNTSPHAISPRAARCAICGKPAEPAYRPFCSKRCADVDLQRWLSGRYVLPAQVRDDAEAGPSEPPDEG